MINNSSLKTGSRTKVFAPVAMAVIVSIAIYNWSISPQTAYVKAAQQYEQIAKDTEHKTLVLEKTINRKQQELEQLKIESAKIEEPFFDERAALGFLSNIEPLAAAAGCTVDSLNYVAPKIIESTEDASSGLIALVRRAEICLKGRYDNIKEFIRRIEDNDKKVFLSDLDIAVSRDYKTLTCSMDITIYSLEGNKTPQVKQ